MATRGLGAVSTLRSVSPATDGAGFSSVVRRVAGEALPPLRDRERRAREPRTRRRS